MLYLVKVTGWRLLICHVKTFMLVYTAHCPHEDCSNADYAGESFPHEDCSYELKQKPSIYKASTPSGSGFQQHLPDGIGLIGQEQIHVAVTHCKRCLLLCIDKV